MEDYRIKVFMAVCNAGSFTKAAERLGITQPAVSQNIAELEKGLGCRLFSRTGGNVSITLQGEVFRRFAIGVLSEYHSLETVFGTRFPAGAAFRIYAEPAARSYLADDLLGELEVLFPECDFSLADSMEGADTCIVSTPVRQDGSLVLRFHVLPADRSLSQVVRVLLTDMLG